MKSEQVEVEQNCGDSDIKSTVAQRKHLTEAEVDQLIGAAREGRNGARDVAMILLAYRHGLRATELIQLRWSDVHFEDGTLFVSRLKGSVSSTHPLQADELRLLRRLREGASGTGFVFVSERGNPLTRQGFFILIQRLGRKVGIKAHPHMLRHACGYKLANQGVDTRSLQAYLGHKSIANTVLYTETSPTRFKDFWRE